MFVFCSLLLLLVVTADEFLFLLLLYKMFVMILMVLQGCIFSTKVHQKGGGGIKGTFEEPKGGP